MQQAASFILLARRQPGIYPDGVATLAATSKGRGAQSLKWRLGRARREQPHYQCRRETRRDPVRAAARPGRCHLAAEQSGVVHGLPVLVKESFDIAGAPIGTLAMAMWPGGLIERSTGMPIVLFEILAHC